MGAASGPNDAVKPGDPVTLTVPSGATGLRVTRPDGRVVELVPGTLGGTSVTFSQTELPGVYTVAAVLPPAESGGPTSSSSTSPTPAASASGSASSSPAIDATTPFRFAVDLFDVAESNIAPGKASAIAALGASDRNAAPSGPATSPGVVPAAVERPAARDELWGPIVLIALAVLCVEWAVYQRDALIRVWRRLLVRRGSSVVGR
jgi:hypothetical protein